VSKPWYYDGLKFACTGCGACCTGAPGYVWVTQAEIQTLAAVLGVDVETFQQQYVRNVGIRKSLLERANGDCVFLDAASRKCRLYQSRPRQCRTWPFWASNLSTPAAWEATSERCPGCNRGRRVPLDKIRAQMDG
jgi:uncharacterized protein